MGLSRYFAAILFALFCLAALLVPSRAHLAGGPTLLAQTNSTRAIAVESVSLVAEPFAPTARLPVGSDHRTRIVLFANNLSLAPDETLADVTVSAEDGNHLHYPLAVEYVGNQTGASGVTAVILRLHDDLGDVGDVLIGIAFRGVTSNDNWKLYELYRAFPLNAGASWNAESGAVFDLNSNALGSDFEVIKMVNIVTP